MSHVRTQLRAAVRVALRAVPAFTGRVIENARGQRGEEELPLLVVRTPTERAENLPDSRKERQQTFTVEFIGGPSANEDDLDAACALIEEALDAPAEGTPLGLLATDMAHVATLTDFNADGESQIGTTTLTFVTTYFTALGDPETAI